MKKQLLTGALLIASFFAVQAQVSYSFESSEGFTVGPLDTQNGWGASLDQFAVTASADATDGDNYLVLAGTGQGIPTGASNPGVFSPLLTQTGNVSISFDINISALGEDNSNFFFASQSNQQQKATARVGFFNDGQVGVVATGANGTPGYYLAGTGTGEAFVPFESIANTWYHVEIIHDYDQDAIGMFIDGEQVFVGDFWAGTAVDNFIFLHDNLAGSAFVDNIEVTGANVAAVKGNTITSLTVYPNPTNGLVTVSTDALVNGVSIVDLNGRTVKTANFAGVSEAQVNISDLSTGVYMMTISSDKGTTTKKIVKN